MNKYIKKIDEYVTELLFPPRCAVCDGVLCFGQKGICEKCRMKLRYVEEPCCLKCGKEIDDWEEEFCNDCKKKHRSFERGFPVFNYIPPVSDAVVAIKYKERQEYVQFYGNEIVKKYGKTFYELGIDALVPVPIHKNRMKKRGFNQAEILAEVISDKTNIILRNDILYRSWDTKPQKELNDDEREKNLHTAFMTYENVEMPQRIMLVDDIYTTGATIEACTRALVMAGAKKVYYTSICIGKV